MDKALVKNRLSSKVVALQNAITDSCGPVDLIRNDFNQGDTRVAETSNASVVDAITMDTLVLVDPTRKKVLVKMDIQGYEHRVLQHASHFFESFDVAYIIMEWILMREHYQTDIHRSRDKLLVERAIGFLNEHNFTPFSVVSHRKLGLEAWYGWPEDVYWVHKNYL
jgi:FkbM family methyltransferase